jgi:hypothetical protein
VSRRSVLNPSAFQEISRKSSEIQRISPVATRKAFCRFGPTINRSARSLENVLDYTASPRCTLGVAPSQVADTAHRSPPPDGGVVPVMVVDVEPVGKPASSLTL